MTKRAKANADHSAIVKEFAPTWLAHNAVEVEIVVPALRELEFDEANLVAGEISKDLINILLADLLQDDDQDLVEPRLEALSRQVDALLEIYQTNEESFKTAIEGAEGKSPSLGSEIKAHYDRVKQRFADVDDGSDEMLGMLAPRRLSIRSSRQQGHRDSGTRQYGGASDRDEQGRFLPDYDRERSRDRYGSQRDEYEGRAPQSRGRFQGDDERYGPRSFGSMGRDRDDEGRFASRKSYEGRGQRGWYGDPEGHSEAARGRGRQHDEDDRYRRRDDEGRGRGGWFGDPEGHSEASRRGRGQRSSYGDSGYGNLEGRGARRGAEEGRSGEGSYGSRSRSDDQDRQGASQGSQERRGRSDYDEQRRSPRGGGGRSGY